MRSYVVPYPNFVHPLEGSGSSYALSEEDGVAAIEPGFVTASTITLPGPGSDHGTPNNGDTYQIADGQNVLAAGTETVTINGGGFRFLALVDNAPALVESVTLGSLVFGAGGETNAPLKAGLIFIFDGNASVWIVL